MSWAIRSVGFGSMFQQNAAILSLTKVLSRLDSCPPIILGGANCEGAMGVALHREFPWIDFICRGEGEILLEQLISHLDRRKPLLEEIPGLIWRRDHDTITNGSTATPVEDLNSNPAISFDDWFRQYEESGLELRKREMMLPVETSRGCWWGARSHCTFCGLNGDSLQFRVKTPQRALDEICALRKYGIKTVHAVDNILAREFMDTLVPRLGEVDHGLQIFYEVRSNLTREEVRSLAKAGIRWVQPGIESLSTSVLKIMRKGITAFQNVRLLKFLAEACVAPTWNILYGFPGEKPEDYAEMAELIPSLTHLYPPTLGCNRVRLDRFSPLFNGGEAMGITRIRAFPTGYYSWPAVPISLHCPYGSSTAGDRADPSRAPSPAGR